MGKVLITGGRGLLGTRLTELLLEKGYKVNTLGRGQSQRTGAKVNSYAWNVETGELDKEAFKGVSTIIHLAGAGIADKRWSDKRKKEIIESRVKSAKLIFDFLKSNKHEVKTFISASAVGYYGDCGDEIISEEHKPGNDFLADVCRQWEKAAINFTKLGIREVRCRIGIVLAKEGGALPELTKTFPLGVAGCFAKTPLYYPWIHIDDVCGIVIHALENEQVNGACNTSAPAPLTMKELMQEIVKAKKAKAIVAPVPPIAIRIALGEMSDLVLSSQRCSAEKILGTGYTFRYKTIKQALRAIYG